MACWHARDCSNDARSAGFQNLRARAALLVAFAGLTTGCALPPGTLEPLSNAARMGQGAMSERDSTLLHRLQNSLEPIGTLRSIYGATTIIRVNGTESESIPSGGRIVAVTVAHEALQSDRIVVDLTTAQDGQP